ncbi:putative F-box protein At4g22660 [Phragmites australis]|uniref:putative F-box protein At4g22660 n=1 Tax=Phragmites australis TaxID=29695 RepID=UPI002D7725A5|nr:putative F-box protein At4g22660 [Phragmites australis]
MKMCNRDGVMSLGCLCRLVLQALPNFFAFFPTLLKKIHKVHPPLMEEAMANNESPELPEDILMDIFALLEIPDLVRVGSVCSSWRAAYISLHSSGRYRRPQTPCLLYTSQADGDNVACLYSLSEKRVYKLTLPEPPIRSRYIIGSSQGWVVTADERSELHLVNPITGEQIALPSVTTIEQVKPIYDDAGVIQQYELLQYYGEEVIADPSIHALDNLRDKLYTKAFVFSDSSTGSYIVVLIHNPIYQLSFARAGDSKWTWLPPSANYDDCIYMDGLLYAVTSTCGIDAFDLTGPTIVRKVVMDDMKNYIYEHLYMAQRPSGDVLLVWREQIVTIGNDEGDDAPERDPNSDIIAETRKIMLYKVNMAAKELVEINGLHDHVLFLGHSQSLCLGAKEYPQLKANHVYLTDDIQGIALWKSSSRDIGVRNLEDNSFEEIVSPQSWCSWPAPIWITPNLTKMSSGLNE